MIDAMTNCGAQGPTWDACATANAEWALKGKLLDPDSARISWPGGGFRDDGLRCGLVNAKNSYGGFTGPRYFMVTVSRDGLVTGVSVEQAGQWVLEASCREKGFAAQ